MRAVIAVKAMAILGVLVGAPITGVKLAAHTDASRAHLTPEQKASQEKAKAEGNAVVNDFPGVLLPPQMANLSPRVDARVLENKVKVGARVQAGQVLVSFDLRELQHDLSIAEAQLKVARAEAAGAYSDAASARTRAKRRDAYVDVGGKRVALVSTEEATQAKFDAQSAGAKAASASAHVSELKARVSQLRLQLEQSEVRAPYEGIVTGIYFEPGMTAHPGDTVARVVGGGQGLRVRIAVGEDAAPLLVRRRVRCALDEKTLHATIDQVAPEVEPSSRTFLMDGNVELDSKVCGDDCALLAGRVVRATLLE
jgi:RND family efflux transporter MFP subunit